MSTSRGKEKGGTKRNTDTTIVRDKTWVDFSLTAASFGAVTLHKKKTLPQTLLLLQ